jgi:hypothetical protein
MRIPFTKKNNSIGFEQLDDEVWPNETLNMMEEAVKMGVKGLKVYKNGPPRFCLAENLL